MKTRQILLKTNAKLSLIDAYGNVREVIEVNANTPTGVPIPLKREFYKDEFGSEIYVYDGLGVLEDTYINIAPFVIDKSVIDDFDNFLDKDVCSDNNRELFESILKVLDMNILKKDYIKIDSVLQLEKSIMDKVNLSPFA